MYYNLEFKNIFERRSYSMKDKILYMDKDYICNIVNRGYDFCEPSPPLKSTNTYIQKDIGIFILR